MALTTLTAGQWISLHEVGNSLVLSVPSSSAGAVLIQTPALLPLQNEAKFLLVASATVGSFYLRSANGLYLKRVVASPPAGVQLGQVITTTVLPSAASDPDSYNFTYVAVPSSSPAAFTINNSATGDALHDVVGVVLFAVSDDDDLQFNAFLETVPCNFADCDPCASSCKPSCGFKGSCKLKTWQIVLLVIVAVIIVALLIWLLVVVWRMWSAPAVVVPVPIARPVIAAALAPVTGCAALCIKENGGLPLRPDQQCDCVETKGKEGVVIPSTPGSYAVAIRTTGKLAPPPIAVGAQGAPPISSLATVVSSDGTSQVAQVLSPDAPVVTMSGRGAIAAVAPGSEATIGPTIARPELAAKTEALAVSNPLAGPSAETANLANPVAIQPAALIPQGGGGSYERYGGASSNKNVNYGGFGYDNVPQQPVRSARTSNLLGDLPSVGQNYAARRFGSGSGPTASSHAVPGHGARGQFDAYRR